MGKVFSFPSFPRLCASSAGRAPRGVERGGRTGAFGAAPHWRTDLCMADASDMVDSLMGELERDGLEPWAPRGGGEACGMLREEGGGGAGGDERISA